jgi:hypothetical protein
LIARTCNRFGPGLGCGQGWQQHRRQDGDYGDDNEQLNKW